MGEGFRGKKTKVSPFAGVEMDCREAHFWVAAFSSSESQKSGTVGLCRVGVVVRFVGAVLD